MVNFISRFLFATTVTAPTFFSLGLIGIIKDSDKYFNIWSNLLNKYVIPTNPEWWSINISFIFMIICFIGIKVFILNILKKTRTEANTSYKTIEVKSFSHIYQNNSDYVISSIIPWLTIFAEQLDFMVLFVCITIQCCIIAISSYNNSNYNLICSIWGYRYYEVFTKENKYILISKKCIKNKNEIKSYFEITDYLGLIIFNNK